MYLESKDALRRGIDQFAFLLTVVENTFISFVFVYVGYPCQVIFVRAPYLPLNANVLVSIEETRCSGLSVR